MSRKVAKKITYKDAGVDIAAGDELVEHIKKNNPSIGGFGGFITLPRGIKKPRLVVSTDGVGTKLVIAQDLKVYDTIGIDLVAMVVNDIITTGAKPISFLDYYAVEKLRPAIAADILKGITDGCRMAGCELSGGETAELPGLYPKEGFDLAGFGVGVVEKDDVIDGSAVKPGDVIIGLPSSGIHSNGYSLARKALLKPSVKGAARKKLMEEMLTPTAIYVEPLLKLIKKVKVNGLAHITGGGIGGNLVRILPKGVQAVLDPKLWEPPAIFQKISTNGPVDIEEMYRVFNMGLGMLAIVSAKDAPEAIRTLRRSMVHAAQVGVIKKGPTKVIIEGVLIETP